MLSLIACRSSCTTLVCQYTISDINKASTNPVAYRLLICSATLYNSLAMQCGCDAVLHTDPDLSEENHGCEAQADCSREEDFLCFKV